MLKNCKKIFALSLAIILSFTMTLTSFGAQIHWDESDITEKIIASENFEGTDYISVSGTLVDGSTVVVGDNSHGKVNSSSSNYIKAFTGKFANDITAGTKITVQFDYYAAGDDTLRVELRDIATSTSKGYEVAEVGSGQAKYWDPTGDLPGMNVAGDGKWHTFKGTINTQKYIDEFIKVNNDVLTYSKAYLYIKLSNGTQLYTDNFIINSEPTILPLMKPVITPYMTATEYEGHKDVYVADVNINSTNNKFNTLKFELPGYFEDGQKYRLSFSYMEAESNARSMMYIWRMNQSAHGTITGWDDGSNLNVVWTPSDSTLGKWQTVTNTITLSSENANMKRLIDDGTFYLQWGTLANRGGTSYDDSTMAGTYRLYIADLKMERVPAVSEKSTTVAFEDDQYVNTGSGLSVAVEGYADTSAAPVINIGGDSVTGSWSNTSVVEGKYVTSVANFDTVTSEKYTQAAPYKATLDIKNIWGITESNPINVTFVNGASQKMEVLTGDWKILANYPNEITNKQNSGWAYKNDLSELYASGKTLIRFSFEAKGMDGVVYTDDAKQSMRNSSPIYLTVTVPAEDLNTYEYKSYSGIVDIGGLDRYVADGSNALDRTTSQHSIYLRGSTGDVNFRNIKLEYFDPEADYKAYVVSRLKVTNNEDGRFSPNGLMMFGEFEGSQLVDIGYNRISYSDTVSGSVALNNALAKDETKYIYFTGVPNTVSGTSVKAFNPSKTYRAYYWDSFGTMQTITGMSESN